MEYVMGEDGKEYGIRYKQGIPTLIPVKLCKICHKAFVPYHGNARKCNLCKKKKGYL